MGPISTLKKKIGSIFSRTRKNRYNPSAIHILDESSKKSVKSYQPDAFDSIGPDEKPSDKSSMIDRLSYLKKVCPSSADCLGFGRERKTIKQIFANFLDTSFIEKNLKRISNGANGFTNLVTYNHKDYQSYAVLKSSKKSDADNLMYEAAVGFYYINKLISYYPCFLETYSLLKYKDITKLEKMSATPEVTADFDDLFSFNKLPDSMEYYDFSSACKEPETNAILIEYVKEPTTFSDYIKNIENEKKEYKEEYYWNVEIINFLYQIYSVLSMISNEYTHYDLHLGNVLLHKPSSYINMEYIYPDGNKVTIKSSYVVKIIDYGRNHCPVSKLYHQYLCFGKDRAECGPTHNIACGIEKGHNFFLEKPTGKKGLAIYEQHLIAYHYLNTLVKNYSCDLRLAHILRLYAINKNNSHVFKKKFLWEETKTLLEKIYYSISSKDMMTDYGTPEFTCKPGKDIIYNVNEMAEKLKNFINSPKYQEKAEKYFKNEKPLGTMIIHLDKSKEIEYIPM